MALILIGLPLELALTGCSSIGGHLLGGVLVGGLQTVTTRYKGFVDRARSVERLAKEFAYKLEVTLKVSPVIRLRGFLVSFPA